MVAFVAHRGKAVLLPLDNVDTDLIIPMQPLLERPRGELGRFAFSAIRYDAAGTPLPSFPFHEPGAEGATIIVAGRNFGCGSSREGAVYALEGLGVRVVIASSFGDIFQGNCVKNGLLPIALDESALDSLRAELGPVPVASRVLSVDLAGQSLATPAGTKFSFDIHRGPKGQLLRGRDEVAATLEMLADIVDFQQRQERTQPWLAPFPPAPFRPDIGQPRDRLP